MELFQLDHNTGADIEFAGFFAPSWFVPSILRRQYQLWLEQVYDILRKIIDRDTGQK